VLRNHDLCSSSMTIYPTPALDISENDPCSEIIPLLSKDDSYFDIHIFSITGQYSNRMLGILLFPVLPPVPFLSKALLFPGWDYFTIAQSRVYTESVSLELSVSINRREEACALFATAVNFCLENNLTDDVRAYGFVSNVTIFCSNSP
jgi:hypothetical protein